jgi:hypothetical protein
MKPEVYAKQHGRHKTDVVMSNCLNLNTILEVGVGYFIFSQGTQHGLLI